MFTISQVKYTSKYIVQIPKGWSQREEVTRGSDAPTTNFKKHLEAWFHCRYMFRTFPPADRLRYIFNEFKSPRRCQMLLLTTQEHWRFSDAVNECCGHSTDSRGNYPRTDQYRQTSSWISKLGQRLEHVVMLDVNFTQVVGDTDLAFDNA